MAELRGKLAYHTGQLYEEVSAFLTTLLPADDPGLGSVLIVDGLEKLRSTSVNDTSPEALPFDSRMLPVPVPHIRPRRGHSTDTVLTTVKELKEVVSRRIPVDQIFASGQIDAIIQASGGHLRDLFTLLRQVMNLILRKSMTPPLQGRRSAWWRTTS